MMKGLMLFSLLFTSTGEGSLFVWDEDILKTIDRFSFNGGNKTLQDKQLHMVGCLGKNPYDLAVLPQNNVSLNPRWDAVVEVHGIE